MEIHRMPNSRVERKAALERSGLDVVR